MPLARALFLFIVMVTLFWIAYRLEKSTEDYAQMAAAFSAAFGLFAGLYFAFTMLTEVLR